MSLPRPFPPLKVGEVFAMSPEPGAPRYRVVRVSPCAAYVRACASQVVEIPGRAPFVAAGHVEAISLRSAVYRVEDRS